MIDNKVEAIKKHFESIMEILEIPVTPSTENTPLRIAKMYCNELFENRNGANLDKLNARMKVFPFEGNPGDVVTLRSIPFNSQCEHHFIVFWGTVEVSYVPNEVIIGLSKIPRVVKYFSKRPQLQERLTNDIGEYLVALLNPRYLTVKINAKHGCVMFRGAESDCETETFFEYVDYDLE